MTAVESRANASRRSSRKTSWDLVRCGCVLLVMLYHATFMSVYLHPELEPRTLRFPYQVGASLLLVVSAYFACVTIGRGTTARYWWNRMARLFPPFAAAVLLVYAAMRLFPVEAWFDPTPEDLRANLLMLWNWKPDLYPFLDGSHWTVPLQLMGFTAAALLYRSRWGHGRRILIVLWAALVVPMLQWPYRINSNVPELYRTLADGFGMHRWHLFVAGVAIWLWSMRRVSTPHFALMLAACMTAQALHNYSETPEGLVADWGSTVGVCAGFCLVALVARARDRDVSLPDRARRAVQWFAGISYGVFLVHQTIGYLVIRGLHDLGAPTTVQTVAMLATGVLLGWALTRLVEQPVHRFLMQGFDRARSAAS